MPFLPVFLWTDFLIYILVIAVSVGILYIRRHPHMTAPWKQVFRQKRGIISIMILSTYVLIGLLDSIHFRQALPPTDTVENHVKHYAPEVITVLDIVLNPIRNQHEKTYSGPLASHSFVREMQQDTAGNINYDYPRLTFGGAHLEASQNKNTDIYHTIINSSAMAFGIWLLLFIGLIAGLAKYQQHSWQKVSQSILKGELDFPWRTMIFMALLMILLFSNTVSLSADYHLLGTDKVGQDVLYQALKSIRTGLVIGTLTTLIMLPFALFMGISAGYFGGWIDDVIQYVYTTLNSIPSVLLIAAAVLMLQVYMNNNADSFTTIAERADTRLLFLCLILGMTSWTGLCRILRGETLKLREAEYVQASKALGVRGFGILWQHILPNLMHIVMISVVLDFSGLVLAEAVLSYVGVGVDPSMISWGNMINSARLEMARDPVVWWSLTAAFISMFTLVLAANLFADVVRDAFDPRMQER